MNSLRRCQIDPRSGTWKPALCSEESISMDHWQALPRGVRIFFTRICFGGPCVRTLSKLGVGPADILSWVDDLWVLITHLGANLIERGGGCVCHLGAFDTQVST